MENGDDYWEAPVLASFYKLALTTPPGLNLDPAENEERELRLRQFHHILMAACSWRWQLRFLEHLTGHLERYRLVMTPRSKIWSKIVREIETEHQQLMGFTIERNTEKASALLNAHRSRTRSAIKKQFLSDSRTTETCI